MSDQVEFPGGGGDKLPDQTGETGKYLKSTGTKGSEEWATPAGSGDMEAADYDPGSVVGDAFDMDNMVEGAATLILTDTERAKLAAVAAGADVTVDVENCTFAGNNYGFLDQASTATTITNCAGVNNTNFQHNVDTVNSCNSEEDGTLVETAGVDFTNPAADDFTVPDADSKLYQAGQDQAAWFDTITGGTDFAGTAWHATTPSIGCFEFPVAAGGLSIPDAMRAVMF